MNVNRRNFIRSGGVLMTGLGTGVFADLINNQEQELKEMQQAVKFTRDGLDLTPLESISLLLELEKNGKIRLDSYSRGGIVSDLENMFAKLLGKEAAIFMPTGTLANHIAIRKLAGKRHRVIVQAESHIYRDSGDCAQNLSRLNLIPINPDKHDFTLEDVQKVFLKTREGRVKTGIGAISLESPVRRKDNQVFPFTEMEKIAEFAREEKLGIHLDGARLFNASVHTGIPPHTYSSLFDTVYISMYKNFNAPSGAILAGSSEFIDELYHTRRMFGGGLPQVWPFAAIALHYANSFLEDYRKAVSGAEDLFKRLQKDPHLEIERIPDGTNVFILRITSMDPDRYREKLREKNIHIPPPVHGKKEFIMKINPTINRVPTDVLADLFFKSVI